LVEGAYLVNEKISPYAARVPPAARPYHHGNLPRVLIDAALEVIDEVGPAAMSFREVATFFRLQGY
jgi:hypothetical protein